MAKLLKSSKRWLLALSLLCACHLIQAQSWLTLRDQGANFYDIKAAFNRQYGNRVKEMNRELRKEVSRNGIKNDKFERQMEGMVQYMRWANFIEPRVKESNGDMSAMGTGMVEALTEQKRLTGVAVDAVIDSVSVATTFKEKLGELGIIFCSVSEIPSFSNVLINSGSTSSRLFVLLFCFGAE